MNRSCFDTWLYAKLRLQLLGTTGTVVEMYELEYKIIRYITNGTKIMQVQHFISLFLKYQLRLK